MTLFTRSVVLALVLATWGGARLASAQVICGCTDELPSLEITKQPVSDRL